jgi:DNA-binding response OmpR family regulator
MGDKHKILVVEDDGYIRDIYNDVLSRAGYSVTVAVDGEEGVIKAKEDTYSLILLDLMMPRLDGIGFLKELKSKAHGHGKIVILTNMAQDPVLTEAMKLGAVAYLIKSDMNPGQLVEHVKKFLG